jgi:flagellar M-ring protein FliF
LAPKWPRTLEGTIEVGTFLEFLKNLGTVRLAIMGVVFVALALFFVFMTTRLTGSNMNLLFSNLDTADSSQVVAQLAQQNIPYEIKNKGTEIFVPSDKVNSARISLASQGLPSSGTVGYEIFDDASALGTTNFMQNISLVRALEGELARTIRSLKVVHSARVHLVLPKRQLFSRDKQSATASVILRLRGSGRLAGEKIAAVQHLVASAVPDLSPDRVAVVDDKGNLLARGDDTDNDAVRVNSLIERKIALETRLTQELTQLLIKSVGPGKVHVRIEADLDFDRISTTEETYNPDGQVVRSTRTIDENASSQESENRTVTVQTNIPDGGQDGQGGPKASTRETKIDESVNFEISKKITNFAREIGTIKRLSVAVLIDGDMVENANGDMEYKPRTTTQMENIAKLVTSAIGFNEDRGDTVEVINMQFADQHLEVEVPLDLFFGLQKNDLLRIAEVVVLSILAILVILLVVRPLVSRAFEALPAAAAAAEQKLLAEAALAAPALTAPEGPPDAIDEFEELIDIDRVEGRVKASSVKKVGEIVEKHPEEALSIIRNWMYQES